MAVKVYNPDKSGDSTLIEPKSLQAHLKAGWLLDDPTKEPVSTAPLKSVEPDEKELAEDIEVLAKMGIEPVYPKPVQKPKPKRPHGRPRKKAK